MATINFAEPLLSSDWLELTGAWAKYLHPLFIPISLLLFCYVMLCVCVCVCVCGGGG